MKLIIQIPCFNEAESLPETLLALPRRLPGVSEIEFLVIDDGSVDGTSEVARRFGVHHIVRHRTNRGLAAAFRSGIDHALGAGADIIVNTDADNQYCGEDVAALVAPIVTGSADIVIGDRGVAENANFSPSKRRLQRLGSATVRWLSNTQVTDAVSGFRALSRQAAQRINITATFSYTTDMLIQAGRKRMAVATVPVRTNGAVRPSRLFRSIPQFIANTGSTMVRAYAMYNPLRFFVALGLAAGVAGLGPILRFLYFVAIGDPEGRVQSLVLGGVLMLLGALCVMLGIVADLIGRNRQLLEHTLQRLYTIEDRLPAQLEEAAAEVQSLHLQSWRNGSFR